jgi:hypothetical protein
MEDLREKTISFWIRTALRGMSWIILMFYMIFRICVPLVLKEPLYLDQNDGKVIAGSIALLLSIEAVKYAIDRWIKKK